MSLEEIRMAIREIDEQMILLLEQRMSLALETKKFKKETLDTAQERAVLEHLTSQSTQLLQKDFLQNLYELIMDESKRLQNNLD